MMIKKYILNGLLAPILVLCLSTSVFAQSKQLADNFDSPPKEYRPETWFHLIGNNISKEGLTKDLEAIKYAGIGGIQLFSIVNMSGEAFPGVKQVETLTPEWKMMVGHAASECERLGLSFTLQNCPGWGLAGGPWVPVEESQRELVNTKFRLNGERLFDGALTLDQSFTRNNDSNYQDICVLAFPTPLDDELTPFVPVKIKTNRPEICWDKIFDPNQKVNARPQRRARKDVRYDATEVSRVDGEEAYVQVRFATPVMLRSLRLPPLRKMTVNKEYPHVDVQLKIEQVVDGKRLPITVRQMPVTNHQDTKHGLTLALPETKLQEMRITFQGSHSLNITSCHFLAQAQINNYEAKAGFTCRSLEHVPNPDYNKACYIRPDTIIDLTEKMDESGNLVWNVPQGQWTVLRFGHVNMLLKNGPATPESMGWDCSKLDQAAIENHLVKGMVGDLARPGGPCGDGKLNGLLIDSWEKFVQTWTMNSETMFTEFQKRRGYDLRLLMPALTGYVVGNYEYTEKFLRDMRETYDDLYVENFFEHFRTVGHTFNALTYSEGAVGEVLPGDPLRYYGVSDIPMTEYWFPGPPGAQSRDAKPVKCAASAAHLYNKKQLAAEAFTQIGLTWNEHPFSVKSLMDLNYALGVNHVVFHTFSHTPQPKVYPGSSFGANIGFPLLRGQTWWRHTPSWINYVTRCQYLLQQGEYAADVLWYLGDDLERAPKETIDFPAGYQFDYINTELLHSSLSVKDGTVRVKDGGQYRIIHLRNSSRMLLSTAKRIKALVEDGAVILGERPQASPSLMDGPAETAALKKIINDLWGKSAAGVKQTGRGKVYWGTTLEEVLTVEKIEPDVTIPAEANIAWIHREIDGVDVYFLSNQENASVNASIGFRVKGKTPETWDPLTGKRWKTGAWSQHGDHIYTALNFAPHGSCFVVFEKNSDSSRYAKVTRNGETVLDCTPGWYRATQSNSKEVDMSSRGAVVWRPGQYILTDAAGNEKKFEAKEKAVPVSGPWELAFEPGWDTPAKIELKKLIPLTKHPNQAVKYYSGTVAYQSTLKVPDGFGDNVILDLGEVVDIAEVWLNGKRVGTRWAPPFHYDVSKYIKSGTNHLTIKATNTWRNQMIYDAARPKGKKKTWTSRPLRNSKELPSPSGLMGPVKLLTGNPIFSLDN